jgi:hypothetical protein
VKKIYILFSLFLFVLTFSQFVTPEKIFAACIAQSGFPLSCQSPNSIVCVISKENIGAKLCCETTQECDDKKKLITTGQQQASSTKICDFITNVTEKNLCVDCLSIKNGVWTAIGCIRTDPSKFFSTVLTFGISIAGGIAFLLILLGGFQILTSSGNPEQLNAGKELVGSAITGLLLIIFSVFFLKIIGVDILGIPGWK